jgi:hypothetical protein
VRWRADASLLFASPGGAGSGAFMRGLVGRWVVGAFGIGWWTPVPGGSFGRLGRATRAGWVAGRAPSPRGVFLARALVGSGFLLLPGAALLWLFWSGCWRIGWSGRSAGLSRGWPFFFRFWGFFGVGFLALAFSRLPTSTHSYWGKPSRQGRAYLGRPTRARNKRETPGRHALDVRKNIQPHQSPMSPLSLHSFPRCAVTCFETTPPRPAGSNPTRARFLSFDFILRKPGAWLLCALPVLAVFPTRALVALLTTTRHLRKLPRPGHGTSGNPTGLRSARQAPTTI